MRVVVEGEASQEVSVESGVPQGTVLGPLLFLCYINDLPDSVTSTIRLFADDCLLYRVIRSRTDHNALQKDLSSLNKWASEWGMKFNAKKCYVLSVNTKSSQYYELDNTILEEVQSSPYLGVQVSNDLSFNAHTSTISSKASSILGFLKRNLQHTPSHLRRTAYLSLVRSTLEYAATVWDPYTQKQIDSLEKVQRQAARFIAKDYRSRSPGCVTKMLKKYELPSLQQRRKELRLSLLYKISEGLIPAIPPEDYLQKVENKRKIRAKKMTDFVSCNIVDKHQQCNSRCYLVPRANKLPYKNSFFVRTIQDWNSLDDDTVSAGTLAAFKAKLSA